MIKAFDLLKRCFSGKQKNLIKSFLYRNNLSRLAVAMGTDKYGEHFYTPHYHNHFNTIRKKKLTILEIGIGGYDNPREGGGSLRMWKAYFPKSKIYGIDIFDKSFHNEKRIKTFKGSQIDEVFLNKVIDEIGNPDIIIDDGSHYNEHIITTFKILFPLLKDKGIYVVEDTQTSYWPEYANEKWGGSEDLQAGFTSMNFLKSLTDGLNYEEFLVKNYAPSYYDKHIVSLHFYHNLVFVYKGKNNEGSNMKE
jgi:demethylmacrocin O-methyltransferase